MCNEIDNFMSPQMDKIDHQDDDYDHCESPKAKRMFLESHEINSKLNKHKSGDNGQKFVVQPSSPCQSSHSSRSSISSPLNVHQQKQIMADHCLNGSSEYISNRLSRWIITRISWVFSAVLFLRLNSGRYLAVRSTCTEGSAAWKCSQSQPKSRLVGSRRKSLESPNIGFTANEHGPRSIPTNASTRSRKRPSESRNTRSSSFNSNCTRLVDSFLLLLWNCEKVENFKTHFSLFFSRRAGITSQTILTIPVSQQLPTNLTIDHLIQALSTLSQKQQAAENNVNSNHVLSNVPTLSPSKSNLRKCDMIERILTRFLFFHTLSQILSYWTLISLQPVLNNYLPFNRNYSHFSKTIKRCNSSNNSSKIATHS